MSPPRRRLTAYQARFVSEYLKDLNGSAAVRRCGRNLERPDQEAYELLRKPEIAEAVAKGRAKQLADAQISAVRVLEEVRRIALVDRRGFFDRRGNLKNFSELSAEEGSLIEGFEVIKKNAVAGDGLVDTVHKAHLAKKFPALELLCQHLGLLTPVPEEDKRERVPVFNFPPGSKIAVE